MDKKQKQVLEYGKTYPKLWISEKLNKAIFRPQRVELTISTRCNLRCKMCIPLESREKVRTGENIDVPSIKRIIDEMHEWGIAEMNIMGFGETLLRDDFFDIVSYASNKNISCTTVTNGTLIDEEMSKKILKSGLRRLAISLDGATPKTHDTIRGVEGAFDRTTQGIKTLNRLRKEMDIDLYIGLITVINNYNFRELPDIVALTKALEVEAIMFQPVHIEELVFESDTKYHVVHNINYKKSNLWIAEENLDKLDQVIDELIKCRARDETISTQIPMLEMIKEYFRNPLDLKFNCIAGYNSMGIGPQGDVYPCWLVESIGNIRGKTLKEIWFSDEFARARLMMKNCPRKCLMACHYLPKMKDLVSLLGNKIKYKTL